MSRHLAELSGADVLVHFAQEVVELACSNIAFHLLIPFIVFPAMEPGSEFGPIFERELFDRGFDLVNAHVLKGSQERLLLQRDRAKAASALRRVAFRFVCPATIR
jgi:hypothetical protein